MLTTALAFCNAARPADSSLTPEPVANLGSVIVVATPVPGSGLNRDRLPQATRVLDSMNIGRTGIPSLTDTMAADLPEAVLNETSGNTFQPDIIYRGFTASPVAGASQGLAVYVNGARFNDAFGDTVNWDLIPSNAIRNVDIESSNPVFGLNALGGSLNVRLKDGFTFQGGGLTAYGGSYGRRAGMTQYGMSLGNFAIYAAADIIHDGGFRQTNVSDLYRLYTDLGWRTDAAELHLGVTAANTLLGNPGAQPVQALAADISSIFTGPNIVSNKYVSLNLMATHALDQESSVQALVYIQTLTQRSPNGITEDFVSCTRIPGVLCNRDGVSPVTTTGGALIPDFQNGGFYSGLSEQGLDQEAYGVSGQITNDLQLLKRKNHLVVGGSFDGSNTIFDDRTLVGGLTPVTHLFIGPGLIIDEPLNGLNPVRVATTTRYFGLFLDDLVTLTPRLDLNFAGRFNDAEIDLADKLGAALNGRHHYDRFNARVGIVYHLADGISLYGDYAENNRAPTPTELSCASVATPCSLANFFVGDPDLRQVVAHTLEAGVRGRFSSGRKSRWSFDLDFFHTRNTDDLIYESSLFSSNLQFYTNAGKTLRQGLEAVIHYDSPRWRIVIGFALTDATFQTPLVLNSPQNPTADNGGQISVRPGDHIPGVPEHRGTLVVDYKATSCWTFGGSALIQSSVYRFGDEANRTDQLAGYAVLNLNTAYRLSDRVTVFVLINNVTNQRYDIYGAFGPIDSAPWSFVPGGVTDPRTASPGMPIAGYGGLRVGF